MAAGKDEHDRDEFDSFGAAALFDYELSQIPRVAFSSSVSPMTVEEESESCRKLREQLCTLEGENKYLRSVNDKINRQLNTAEEEKKRLKMICEQESRRQCEAIKTDLAFKTKEIHDLNERCKHLNNLLQQQSSTVHTTRPSPRIVEPHTTRKRPRPHSPEEYEPNPKHSQPVSDNNKVPTLNANLIVACRSSAVLASEGGMHLIREVMKNLAISQPIKETPLVWAGGVSQPETVSEPMRWEESEEEGRGSDQSVRDSSSLEVKTESESSSQFGSSSPDSSIEVLSNVHVTSDSTTTDSYSGVVLKNMLRMYESSACQYLSSSSSLPADFDCGVSSSRSLLHFIEQSILSYHTLLRSLQSHDSSADSSFTQIPELEDISTSSGSTSSGISNKSEYQNIDLQTLSPHSASFSPIPPSHTSCDSFFSQSTCSSSSSSTQGTHQIKTKGSVNVSQIFAILGTLCKFSQSVRRDISHARSTGDTLKQVASYLPSLEEEPSDTDSQSHTKTDSYHQSPLVQLSELSFPSISSLSNRVLLPKNQARPPIRLRNSLYNGNLFQVLIQTLLLLAHVHKLKKKVKLIEMLNYTLDILVSLSKECDNELLERYSVLIQKEQNVLEALLRIEEPTVTLNVLLLLTCMSRCPFNVSQLCSVSKSCVLGNCYTLFTDSLSVDKPIGTIQIWTQLIRFISQALCTDGGDAVLLESSCGCSVQLMRSLLKCLVNVLYTIDCEQHTPYSNERLLLMMLSVVQIVLHNPKQREELRQDLTSRHRCLCGISTCMNWPNAPPEEILQDIYQQLMMDSDEEDT